MGSKDSVAKGNQEGKSNPGQLLGRRAEMSGEFEDLGSLRKAENPWKGERREGTRAGEWKGEAVEVELKGMRLVMYGGEKDPAGQQGKWGGNWEGKAKQ
ncbi:hypothetical protein SAY87_031833 [Trapa incisa]|uniref:Uncharacterized protein n=1 Tax=Trapa incisa TaxID=236973 RepID=A0AAN7QM66_9MYRT|nr:hypothetical protein SAY87_031833 [Trapa incisa]